jgi:hypothetical protein
LKMLPDPER